MNVPPDSGGISIGARKRAIYESLSARRRAFIDRIGYDQWNPFQEPKNPLDLHRDAARRAARQLVNEFLRSRPQDFSDAFAKGALECASGIVGNDEKHRGAYEFCIWYHEFLRREDCSHESEL